jgi:glucosamine-6-phosphate deaminase
MSEVAAGIVTESIATGLKQKEGFTLGLATGSSPTGLYKHLAGAANAGVFDATRIQSFNLDEYVGLPGENAQQRALHPESYSFFMIQEFFGLLQKKFREVNVPWGTLIDQDHLIAEMKSHPKDWQAEGTDKGKSIVIRPDAQSEYLLWIRREILNAYGDKIERAGGIDFQVIGVGGRGHVAFHESGIPFADSRVLLVRLDDNTVANAVSDGHFASREESPRYAISMGVELVYRARTVLLLAIGSRKTAPSPNPFSRILRPWSPSPTERSSRKTAAGSSTSLIARRAKRSSHRRTRFAGRGSRSRISADRPCPRIQTGCFSGIRKPAGGACGSSAGCFFRRHLL